MSKLSLFPTLEDDLIEKIEYVPTLSELFYTSKEGYTNKIELDSRESDIDIEVVDLNRVWNVKFDDLIFEKKIVFKSATNLFGQYGIAPTNASIGVGYTWFSKKTKLRKSGFIGCIHPHQNYVELDLKIRFDEGTHREKIEIVIFLYLHRMPDQISFDERKFASLEGSRLGTLDVINLYIEGTGSSFPVYEEEILGNPLWRYSANWVNFEDSFNDHVALVINKAHKNYKDISPDSGKRFNKLLLEEIMISFMTIFLNDAINREAFDYIDSQEILVDGSVGQIVAYYRNNYQIESRDVGEIYYQISKGLR